MNGDDSVHRLVDHLFRREAGRMVASLTRSFGPAHLDLAEEVVQEALVQALKRWPFGGVPDQPVAWLYRVARNLALDRFRRHKTFRGKAEVLARESLPLHDEAEDEGVFLSGEITDDQLRLIFLCCHPDLGRDARVALTLKAVLGFSVREIARAFLSRETTVAQRLVRAQRRIKERGIPFEVPEPAELPARLDAVLEALYLAFNEGYGAHEGDRLVRADLCAEALRLVAQLAEREDTGRPAVHALAALLSFQASRLPARVDDDGNLLLLAEQDRSRWDRGLLRQAFGHFSRAAAGDELTTYHLEAAIAAHHAKAASGGDTDWTAILGLYDQLLALNPSPIVALNRAVALAGLRGPEAGLAAVAEIETHPALADYYLLPATRADLFARLGDTQQAAECYRQALARPCSEPERRFLQRRLEGLAG
jgi:RNA polymerase sigma-70 factor (ECF subfamily)